MEKKNSVSLAKIKLKQETRSKPELSVVLSTYNPREDYLRRTLEGVRKQTLPKEKWEFILVDNASSSPLEGRVDLSGLPPGSRIVVETHQGLSHARRRGFQEARADLIVNLDDDAVLDSDYLWQVQQLAENYPFIGVFGCRIRPEFERAPDRPVGDYYGAQRVVREAVWSNDREHYASNPWGLGSVVRRHVADAYVQRLSTDERLAKIGRSAENLLACEDDDIAMMACDIGLGKGVFPTLSITHLISAKRMTGDFLVRNAHGKGYSAAVLAYLRFGRLPSRRSVAGTINRIYRLARMDALRRKQEVASERGVKDALADMSKWGWIKRKTS